MDVLSDVLRSVKMTGAFFFDVTNHAPWACGEPGETDILGRILPQHDMLMPFHVILFGSAILEMDGPRPVTLPLEAGDVVVIPSGAPHFMMSTPGMRALVDHAAYDPPIGPRQINRYAVNADNGTPVHSRVICGYMGIDRRPASPLWKALPPVFRVRAAPHHRDRLLQLSALGVAESEEYRTGADAMLAKLAELMFVEAVRQLIDDPAQQAGGLVAGLRDRHVGAALQVLHARPTDDWTLDALAQQVGLSRSVLAARFTELVGMPAMQYLARWRLILAAKRLEEPGVSVAEAAMEVGYQSDAAFQKAFKRHVGVTPSAWRKRTMASKAETAVAVPA
ncbi:MAG: AraC family transcriptional regulator [Paracoccaceae bacterium]